ncbi:LOW QUALITY PROTEIN: hypothetical protein M8C21_002552, partial [Ambrosia artemisiifolia]
SEIADGDEQSDVVRIGNYTDGQFPTNNKEFAKCIFYTVCSLLINILVVPEIITVNVGHIAKRVSAVRNSDSEIEFDDVFGGPPMWTRYSYGGSRMRSWDEMSGSVESP